MTFPSTPPADIVAAYREAVKNSGEPSCPSCKLLSHKLSGTQHELLTVKAENETLRDKISEIESKLAIVTGATATVNQQAFIRKITDQEAAARRSMALQGKDLAAVIDERDDLRKACERAGISTAHVRQHFVGKPLCCTHGEHEGICGAIMTPMSSYAAPGNCQCEGIAES